MPDHHQPPHDDAANHRETAATRRTVLRAAGLVALAGGGGAVLAACAADSGTTAGPSATAPSAPASSAASSPAAEATTASPAPKATKATKAAKAPTGPSVATSKVPVGGGVILDDADFVVTQPSKGDYKAFSKICTHQGCKVAEIANNNIVCKCHGSSFSIKDGSVTNPPASKPLPESTVEVFEGKAYVTG
jgi:Rieske Fe-S protein